MGEKLEAIQIPECWIVVIRPNCHVNTGEIFSDEKLTRNSKSITIADFIAGQHQNDCLDVVCRRYRAVKESLAALSEFAEGRLTGTGACVFAQFDSEQSAKHAYAALSGRWECFLTKGVNQSPLYSKLGLSKSLT